MPLDGCIMAKADPHELDSASIARRLRILRQHSQGGEQGSQARFAAQIGVEYRRWNNYERGHPLSRDMAVLLVRKVLGLTLDWIYLGREDTLPVRLQRELEAAGKAVTLSEEGSDDGDDSAPPPGARTSIKRTNSRK